MANAKSNSINPDKGYGDTALFLFFIVLVAAGPILMAPFGGSYPDLLQKFAIFGIISCSV